MKFEVLDSKYKSVLVKDLKVGDIFRWENNYYLVIKFAPNVESLFREKHNDSLFIMNLKTNEVSWHSSDWKRDISAVEKYEVVTHMAISRV